MSVALIITYGIVMFLVGAAAAFAFSCKLWDESLPFNR